MLTLLGGGERFCDGVSRRGFLQVGALGFCGLTLADLLRADATAGSAGARKSIINIYLPGGPSHMDTFDLKPQAPAEFRGEFQPIDTNVPGVQICEHMPRLAGMADKLAIVRSISNFSEEHSSYQSDSGWSDRSLQSVGGRPSLGSVVCKLQGEDNPSAPAFVQLSGNAKPGFLGPVYQPYRPDGPGRSNLSLNGQMNVSRLDDRTRLLNDLDRIRRRMDGSGTMDAIDSFNQRAVGVITSSRLAEAFDLEREDPRLKERYGLGDDGSRGRRRGRGRGNQSFLLARRLIEAGVRSVYLSWGGWDTHGDNFNQLRRQLPSLDIGLAAMIEDLDARGLLQETLIMVSGEFGRTPRVNGGAGRDHWPRVGFVLLAGGGMRTGQVIGASNRLGEYPQDRPVNFQEIFATLYHLLGIDPAATTLRDTNGRPQYLVDVREPMRELL